MRRVVFALIALGIVAIVVIGLTQREGGNETPQPTGSLPTTQVVSGASGDTAVVDEGTTCSRVSKPQLGA